MRTYRYGEWVPTRCQCGARLEWQADFENAVSTTCPGAGCPVIYAGYVHPAPAPLKPRRKATS